MKGRCFILSLMLSLTLTFAMLSNVQANIPDDFSVTGEIEDMSTGLPVPVGSSGRWIVMNREVTGSISGDIDGSYTMTYQANIESIDTQAGNFHGTFTVDEFIIKINGKSEPLEFTPTPPYGNLPKITINGYWNFISGAQGAGTFYAWLIFIPDQQGHIDIIVDSEINFTGIWQPA